MTITVDLMDLVGTSLIVPSNTGVVYRHRCGGPAGGERSLEGYLVPFHNEQNMEPELMEISSRYWVSPTCDDWIAYYLDRLLAKWDCGISIDRDRMEESTESWLWVKVDQDPRWPLVSGTSESPLSALLVWTTNRRFGLER